MVTVHHSQLPREMKPIQNDGDLMECIGVVDTIMKDGVDDSFTQAYLDFQSEMIQIYEDEIDLSEA